MKMAEFGFSGVRQACRVSGSKIFIGVIFSIASVDQRTDYASIFCLASHHVPSILNLRLLVVGARYRDNTSTAVPNYFRWAHCCRDYDRGDAP
jgi:hypothetical protein